MRVREVAIIRDAEGNPVQLRFVGPRHERGGRTMLMVDVDGEIETSGDSTGAGPVAYVRVSDAEQLDLTWPAEPDLKGKK